LRHSCLPACRKVLLECLQRFPAGAGDAADTAAALSWVLPDGQTIYSRAAVDSCSLEQLQALLASSAASDTGAAALAAQALAAAAAAAEGAVAPGSSSLTGAKLKAMQVNALHNMLHCYGDTVCDTCTYTKSLVAVLASIVSVRAQGDLNSQQSSYK
jgi:alpha/beta superfamily hydrolase